MITEIQLQAVKEALGELPLSKDLRVTRVREEMVACLHTLEAASGKTVLTEDRDADDIPPLPTKLKNAWSQLRRSHQAEGTRADFAG